eukprot:15262259-Ditylum_brightwellii.AAC.1
MGELGGGLTSPGVQCLLPSLLLPTSTGTSKWLDICTWIDVVVSTTDRNPCVRGTKKGKMLLNVPYSCLVLIGSMSPVGMPLDGLQKFASKHGIPRCQCMKKLNLCQAIVVAKGKHDIAVANKTAEVTDPRTSLST